MTRRSYTAHRAPILTDTPEPSQARPWVAPQGRPAWVARRCSPEPETMIIDRLPEAFDPDDQSDSADGVFWVYMATIGAVIAAAVVAVLA